MLRHAMISVCGQHVGTRREAVKTSPVELAKYDAQSGIRLGLENPFHLMDISSPGELATFSQVKNDLVLPKSRPANRRPRSTMTGVL